ncbi:MAG: hypothetical protein CBB97_07930 [Candidatus Endolissoclinum sp. TMED37]|nr:MAG: hypothetical protein CBB97_07930 [Candidatus Endolissoclinum sp. TMED37]
MKFRFLEKLFYLNRTQKKFIFYAIDTLLMTFSFILAMYLRLDNFTFLIQYENLLKIFLIFPINLLIFNQLNLYQTVIRYISYRNLSKIFYAVLISSFLMLIISKIPSIFLPRSVPIIYMPIMLISMASVRFFINYLYQYQHNFNKKRVAIFGAREEGRQVLNLLEQNIQYNPILFFDYDKNLINTNISGLRVYNFDKDYDQIKKNSIDIILLTLPDNLEKLKTNIFSKIELHPLEIKKVENLNQTLFNNFNFDQLDNISVEELIDRSQIRPRKNLLKSKINGKVIFISGGGGSIGSELCKQIISMSPKKLFIFDFNEYSIYKIKNLLKSKSKVTILPVLGSIVDTKLLDNFFKTNRVDIIYHAAAYKHVDIIENNIINGIKNNVFGTHNLAKVAIKYNVKKFILISSDKAVRPMNVMGATKRISEIICQSLSNEQNKTKFSIVRFGNVMSSSGSVIPLFKKQIFNGGPVTVTDKKITRFFMTKIEASQLVIQAGSLSKGGEVFVLDMGKPIKIFDLAVKMIHLTGNKVNTNKDKQGDGISIKITGLRSGEKLYEELFSNDNFIKSSHPKIFCANEKYINYRSLKIILKNLAFYCESNNLEEIENILKIPEINYLGSFSRK